MNNKWLVLWLKTIPRLTCVMAQSVEFINPCLCLPLEHHITTACTLCPCLNPPSSASNERRRQSNIGLRRVFDASKHAWTVHVGNVFMIPAMTKMKMNYAVLSFNILSSVLIFVSHLKKLLFIPIINPGLQKSSNRSLIKRNIHISVIVLLKVKAVAREVHIEIRKAMIN